MKKTYEPIKGTFISIPGKMKALEVTFDTENCQTIGADRNRKAQDELALIPNATSHPMTPPLRRYCKDSTPICPIDDICISKNDSNSEDKGWPVVNEEFCRDLLESVRDNVLNKIRDKNRSKKYFISDESIRLIIDFFKEWISYSWQDNDDGFDIADRACLSDVLEKITELQWRTFKQVDLTKAFQKRFKAKVIEKCLKHLQKKGALVLQEKPTGNKSGRKPSPQYSVNMDFFKEGIRNGK